ncbi:hypothetical protein LCGC14_1515700 [marine sediment metagenome]|uniref:Uncharacterized protein n=1 Tax=marine sediment metagenome TaxID=412755 RepID=A0A0F9JKU8_9ZZZZ
MPKSKHWTSKSFSINVAELDTTWKDIEEIAEREKASVSSIIVKSLRDYAKIHRDGNFQTKWPSYAEGGIKSKGQVLQELNKKARQFFLERGKASRSEILEYLKEKGIPGQERVSIANGLLSWLKDKIEVTI